MKCKFRQVREYNAELMARFGCQAAGNKPAAWHSNEEMGQLQDKLYEYYK